MSAFLCLVNVHHWKNEYMLFRSSLPCWTSLEHWTDPKTAVKGDGQEWRICKYDQTSPVRSIFVWYLSLPSIFYEIFHWSITRYLSGDCSVLKWNRNRSHFRGSMICQHLTAFIFSIHQCHYPRITHGNDLIFDIVQQIEAQSVIEFISIFFFDDHVWWRGYAQVREDGSKGGHSIDDVGRKYTYLCVLMRQTQFKILCFDHND